MNNNKQFLTINKQNQFQVKIEKERDNVNRKKEKEQVKTHLHCPIGREKMNFNQLDGAHLLAARPRLAACTGRARATRRGATTARLWPMPISFAGVVILEFIRKTKKVTAGIARRDVQRATCDL